MYLKTTLLVKQHKNEAYKFYIFSHWIPTALCMFNATVYNIEMHTSYPVLDNKINLLH